MQFTREPIFVAAVRTFCTAFSSILGILVAIAVVCIALMFFAKPDIYPKKSELTIAPDAQGNREMLSIEAPVVLRIDVRGVIGQGDLTGSKFSNMLLDSQEGMLEKRIKAVLLYIDTPGGTVNDADEIYRALLDYKQKYQVPLYAFVDGLCASGGMYIACAADKIFASATSIIGSVGVILGPAFNIAQLMDRYGVQALTITEGKDKDALSPFRPWKPGEDANIRNVTAHLYQRFVSIVIGARKQMQREKLIDDYGAQIYISSEAQQLGYIDVADSNYSAALSDLALAAQIDAKHYQVMQISPPHPFFSDFAQEKMGLLQGKLTHVFHIGPYMDSDLSGRFLYLYQP